MGLENYFTGIKKVAGYRTETTVFIIGVPTGSRTPVTGVKGPCPRPLDDGDVLNLAFK
jgi:hypothetical protein